MIEFHADCGHTIRARDEDAGKVVSCAYCGKKATVPSSEDGGMESLLSDALEESRDMLEELEGGAAALRKDGAYWAPLRIVWTAVFLILVLSVLILTVRWVVQMVWSPDDAPSVSDTVVTTPGESAKPSWFTKPEKEEAVQPPPPTPETPEYVNSLGDLDTSKSGVVVFSIPAGLEVYVQREPISEDDQGMKLRDLQQGMTHPHVGLKAALEPGPYVISVVAMIRNPDLNDYPDYRTKVRRVARDHAGDAETILAAAQDYFLPNGPDDRVSWRLARLHGQECLVMRHRIQLGHEWRPIYAMFVPDVSCNELLDYVDGQRHFAFDERRARQELEVLEVPETEYTTVLTALYRIGKAVLADPAAGKAKVFEVRPNDFVIGEEIIIEQMIPSP